MPDDLTADDQRRIAGYLAKIGRDMRTAGAGPAEIEAVRAALREQLDEARREAGPGASVEDILKSIDPPMAFADATARREDGEAGLGRLGLALALGVAALSFLILPLAGGAAESLGPPVFFIGELSALALGYTSRATAAGRAALMIGALCLALFALAALVNSGA